jgi:hypothetical protein
VRKRYQDALGAMTEFVAMFLETGTEVQKDVRLVKALLDLIQQDDSMVSRMKSSISVKMAGK